MSFSEIVNWLIDLIRKSGLWGIFIGSFLEEIIAPIPSSVVLVFGGYILLSNYSEISLQFLVDLSLIVLFSCLGATLGALFPYGLFYWGGKKFVDKFGFFFGFKWVDVENLNVKLHSTKFDELAIFLLRLLPIVPSILLASGCGALRINLLKFTLLFFSGGIIRHYVFAFLGWYVGVSILTVLDSIDKFFKYIFVALLTMGIFYFIQQVLKNIKKK